MVKRRLTGDELKMANKMLVQRMEELEWNDYQIGYHEMMLKSGLQANYKKTVRDYKAKLSEFKGEKAMTDNIIKVLREQIRNGVEVKEESEGEVE